MSRSNSVSDAGPDRKTGWSRREAIQRAEGRREGRWEREGGGKGRQCGVGKGRQCGVRRRRGVHV